MRRRRVAEDRRSKERTTAQVDIAATTRTWNVSWRDSPRVREIAGWQVAACTVTTRPRRSSLGVIVIDGNPALQTTGITVDHLGSLRVIRNASLTSLAVRPTTASAWTWASTVTSRWPEMATSARSTSDRSS
jgi:hypothetical protein